MSAAQGARTRTSATRRNRSISLRTAAAGGTANWPCPHRCMQPSQCEVSERACVERTMVTSPRLAPCRSLPLLGGLSTRKTHRSQRGTQRSPAHVSSCRHTHAHTHTHTDLGSWTHGTHRVHCVRTYPIAPHATRLAARIPKPSAPTRPSSVARFAPPTASLSCARASPAARRRRDALALSDASGHTPEACSPTHMAT